MIKVEVIKEFTLNDFNKIKDTLNRKSRQKDGYLFLGDTFECDEPMMKYLTGDNKFKQAFVKVIEVIKEAKIEEKEMEKLGKEIEEYFEKEEDQYLKNTKKAKKKKK